MFFDTKPLGQILNRFSKDLDVLGKLLIGFTDTVLTLHIVTGICENLLSPGSQVAIETNIKNEQVTMHIQCTSLSDNQGISHNSLILQA